MPDLVFPENEQQQIDPLLEEFPAHKDFITKARTKNYKDDDIRTFMIDTQNRLSNMGFSDDSIDSAMGRTALSKQNVFNYHKDKTVDALIGDTDIKRDDAIHAMKLASYTGQSPYRLLHDTEFRNRVTDHLLNTPGFKMHEDVIPYAFNRFEEFFHGSAMAAMSVYSMFMGEDVREYPAYKNAKAMQEELMRNRPMYSPFGGDLFGGVLSLGTQVGAHIAFGSVASYAAAGIAGFFLAPAGFVAGAAAAAGIGMRLALSIAQETGHANIEYLDEGMDVDTARMAAGIAGTVSGTVDFLQSEFLIRGLHASGASKYMDKIWKSTFGKMGFGQSVSDAIEAEASRYATPTLVREGLKAPRFANELATAIKQNAARSAGMWASEVAQEGLQREVILIGRDVAKYIKGFDMPSLPDIARDHFGQVMSEMSEAAGPMAVLALVGMNGATRIARHRYAMKKMAYDMTLEIKNREADIVSGRANPDDIIDVEDASTTSRGIVERVFMVSNVTEEERAEILRGAGYDPHEFQLLDETEEVVLTPDAYNKFYKIANEEGQELLASNTKKTRRKVLLKEFLKEKEKELYSLLEDPLMADTANAAEAREVYGSFVKAVIDAGYKPSLAGLVTKFHFHHVLNQALLTGTSFKEALKLSIQKATEAQERAAKEGTLQSEADESYNMALRLVVAPEGTWHSYIKKHNVEVDTNKVPDYKILKYILDDGVTDIAEARAALEENIVANEKLLEKASLNRHKSEIRSNIKNAQDLIELIDSGHLRINGKTYTNNQESQAQTEQPTASQQADNTVENKTEAQTQEQQASDSPAEEIQKKTKIPEGEWRPYAGSDSIVIEANTNVTPANTLFQELVDNGISNIADMRSALEAIKSEADEQLKNESKTKEEKNALVKRRMTARLSIDAIDDGIVRVNGEQLVKPESASETQATDPAPLEQTNEQKQTAEEAPPTKAEPEKIEAKPEVKAEEKPKGKLDSSKYVIINGEYAIPIDEIEKTNRLTRPHKIALKLLMDNNFNAEKALEALQSNEEVRSDKTLEAMVSEILMRETFSEAKEGTDIKEMDSKFRNDESREAGVESFFVMHNDFVQDSTDLQFDDEVGGDELSYALEYSYGDIELAMFDIDSYIKREENSKRPDPNRLQLLANAYEALRSGAIVVEQSGEAKKKSATILNAIKNGKSNFENIERIINNAISFLQQGLEANARDEMAKVPELWERLVGNEDRGGTRGGQVSRADGRLDTNGIKKAYQNLMERYQQQSEIVKKKPLERKKKEDETPKPEKKETADTTNESQSQQEETGADNAAEKIVSDIEAKGVDEELNKETTPPRAARKKSSKSVKEPVQSSEESAQPSETATQEPSGEQKETKAKKPLVKNPNVDQEQLARELVAQNNGKEVTVVDTETESVNEDLADEPDLGIPKAIANPVSATEASENQKKAKGKKGGSSKTTATKGNPKKPKTKTKAKEKEQTPETSEPSEVQNATSEVPVITTQEVKEDSDKKPLPPKRPQESVEKTIADSLTQTESVVEEDEEPTVAANKQDEADSVEDALNIPDEGSVMGMMEKDSEGNRVITIFQSKNNATIIHELAHVVFDDLKQLATMKNPPDWALKAISDINDLAVAWSEKNMGRVVVDDTTRQEAFAEGLLSYIENGNYPSLSLRSTISRLRGHITNLFKTGQLNKIELSKAARDVYQRLYATDREIDYKNIGLREYMTMLDLDETDRKLRDLEFIQKYIPDEGQSKALAGKIEDFWDRMYKEEKRLISEGVDGREIRKMRYKEFLKLMRSLGSSEMRALVHLNNKYERTIKTTKEAFTRLEERFNSYKMNRYRREMYSRQMKKLCRIFRQIDRGDKIDVEYGIKIKELWESYGFRGRKQDLKYSSRPQMSERTKSRMQDLQELIDIFGEPDGDRALTAAERARLSRLDNAVGDMSIEDFITFTKVTEALAKEGEVAYKANQLKLNADAWAIASDMIDRLGGARHRPGVITDQEQLTKNYDPRRAMQKEAETQRRTARAMMVDEIINRRMNGEDISTPQAELLIDEAGDKAAQRVIDEWGVWDNIKSRIGAYTSSITDKLAVNLLDPHRLADLWDGGRGTFDGPFYKLIVTEMSRCEAIRRQNTMRRVGPDFFNELQQMLAPAGLRMESLGQMIQTDDPELKKLMGEAMFTRAQVMGVYIHVKLAGEKNVGAVLGGNFNGIADQEAFADKLIALLTPQEIEVAKKIFDVANDEETFKRYDAVLRKVDNKVLKREDRYFPIHRIERSRTHDPITDEEPPDSVLARVDPGSSKERLKINRENQTAIDLNPIRTMLRNIDEVEHYIAYAEALDKMRRVFTLKKDPSATDETKGMSEEAQKEYNLSQERYSMGEGGVRAAIEQRFGSLHRMALEDLYNEFAAPFSRRNDDFLNGLIGAWARNTAVVALVGNTSTYLKNFVSMGKWFIEANPAYVMESLADFTTNGTAFLERVYSLSPQLAYRRGNAFYDLLKKDPWMVNSEFGRVMNRFVEMGLEPNAMIDRWVAAVMFDSAYRRKLAELRNEDGSTPDGATDAAIRFAQDVVDRNMQPVTKIQLPSLWRHRRGMTQIPLLFTTEAAKLINIIGYDIPRKIRNMDLASVGRLTLATAISSILLRALTAGGPDDDEDETWFKWSTMALADYTIGGIPVVGDAIMAKIENKSRRDSLPIVDYVWDTLNGAATYITDKENEMKANGLTTRENGTIALMNLMAMMGAPIPANAIKRGYNAMQANSVVDSLLILAGNKTVLKRMQKERQGK